MTLEAAIAENTAAVRELIAQLRSGTALQQPSAEEIDANIKALNAAQEAAAPKPTPAAKPAAPAPTPPTAEAPASAPSPRANEPADPPSAEAHADAPDYAATARAINTLVKAKGRQAAVDVLASFKASTLKDVQPAQYAAVIAACEGA